MYTALVLTPASQKELLNHFSGLIPPTWQKICHHMTINMGNAGSGPLQASQFNIGENAELTVITVAGDEKVIAVGVETNVPTANKVKHITLAVNRQDGGKPFHSNNLTNWQPTSPIKLQGVIEEVQ
jgi:hypothetical protein